MLYLALIIKKYSLLQLEINSNILSLGARETNSELAYSILEKFLDTSFLGGRHLDRIRKINNINNINPITLEKCKNII